MNGQGIDLRPVFSTYCYACHKTRTHLAPVPSRGPTPRQHILRITRGFGELSRAALASWGIPPNCGIRLAACSGNAGEPQWVPPFRVSIFRDFRTVLCAVSLIRIEWRPPIGLVGGRMGTCPVWACLRLLSHPSAGLAGSNSRRLRTFVEYPAHSHLLEASPLSASSLSPSRPCTPPCVRHSQNVGRCCHSSTWRVGVDQLATGRTYMDTQLLKSRWITLGVRPRYRANFTAQPRHLSMSFRANGSQKPRLGAFSLKFNLRLICSVGEYGRLQAQ